MLASVSLIAGTVLLDIRQTAVGVLIRLRVVTRTVLADLGNAAAGGLQHVGVVPVTGLGDFYQTVVARLVAANFVL
ncbi:MAG: hypothetical protein L0G81_11030 [Ewingella sp.]|nr:hypothetical protein [Ewingella sp.]